ncbi:unnamed protein product [Trichobilharzia regenti]|nr:unnamed protein product [Trichobilharzia regenti]
MVLGEICAQSIKMVYAPSEPTEHKTTSSSDTDVGMEAKKVRKSWVEIVRSYDPKMIDNGFCDTFTATGAIDRCYHSFIPGYLSDLAFWPLLQTINFAFVPTAYRVLYVAFFTSIWNTYLCFFNARMSANTSQHNEDKEENSQLQKKIK